MRACLVFLLLWATFAGADTVEQKSNTDENLRGVSAISARVAWASGTHGTYLRTTDGGATWEVGHVSGAEMLDFRDVEAFSADEAYLLAAGPGEQSRIYKTADAGKNWILQFANKDPKGFFDCVAFWDGEHGIAVGDPVEGKFQVITTNNGGKEWKPVLPEKLPTAVDGEGAFAASGTCIAVEGNKNVWFVTGGSAARVFRSVDAGESWTVTETPLFHGPASAGIFSVAFRDAKHGVIAGGDYKEPNKNVASLALTSDGGSTWRLAKIAPQKYFSAVAFVRSERRVLAVGTEQYAWAQGFNDKKWELFLPAIPLCGLDHAQLNALAVIPKGHGAWIVGAKGAIFLLTAGRPLKSCKS
jgi:photosystem II stability/assembly factor-like uncharacterized protein